MNVRKINIADLNPAKYNPRKDLKPEDAEFEKLKKSIETFGYVEPIVINIKNNNTVISGHQRLKVLKYLGHNEAECVLVELDNANEKALNLTMNKASGSWEKESLAELLKELKDLDYDVSVTGFDAPEIGTLFNDVFSKDVKDDDFDLEKELEEPVISKQGDLWILGRHRLLCGDATKEDDVAKLMDGKKANLIVTDLPYNVNYEGEAGKIKNDNLPDKEFKELLINSFKNMYENLVDGGAFYCFHSDSEKVNFFNATVEAGFHYSATCVWVKNNGVQSFMDYRMRHEPIIYAFKDTKRHNWYGGRKATTVWEFNRPNSSKLHPTTKPLPLLGYPIRNSSLENSIVMDLFGGSGSVLLCCEQLNRICHMMEIDEKFVDVIVKRFYQYSLEQKNSDEDIFLIRAGKKLKYRDI